jgi:hypothetical protein
MLRNKKTTDYPSISSWSIERYDSWTRTYSVKFRLSKSATKAQQKRDVGAFAWAELGGCPTRLYRSRDDVQMEEYSYISMHADICCDAFAVQMSRNDYFGD